jgi:hypothetical protein
MKISPNPRHLTANISRPVIAAILFAVLLTSCSEKKDASLAPAASPLFKRIPSSQSTITFSNDLDETYDNYFDRFAYVYNGAGVGVGDINNDGLPDIYFTGNEVPNKLYLNKGNLVFEDITDKAGVAGNGKWNNGIAMVDINEDGLLDIYVCKGGWHETPAQRKNLLFVNQGDLTFKEQANEFGLAEPGYSIHASFFDMDNDSDLDLYVTNRPDSFDLPLSEMVRQKKLSPSGSRDKLYRNDNKKFTEIGVKAGIVSNFGYALSVITSDLNNDGYADIFVANDFAESDYLYINQKNGTFKESIRQTTNHISMYSMGTDVADINNDGLEDIMVTEMLPEDYRRSKVSMPSMDVEGFNELINSGMHKQYMHNVLHLNHGNNFFGDVSQIAGVTKSEWSWSVLMSDFDNDTDRDIFIANGYKRDVFDGDVHHKLAAFVRQNHNKYNSAEELLTKEFKTFIDLYRPIVVSNYMFRNNGDLVFENVAENWGLDDPSISHGAAIGDLDNDGDLDLVVNNMDDEAFVYENTSKANYIKVKLEGPPQNAFGIGAKVTVYAGGIKQFFENKTSRGYLSSNDPVVHFGLGKLVTVDSIMVSWTDGRRNQTLNVSANQTFSVAWKDAAAENRRVGTPATLIAESPSLLMTPFTHKENEVAEYKEQVLLPHGFSRAGPFIASGDVNGDGTEDFYVGGAKGQAGALYKQANNKFELTRQAAFEKDKEFEDAGATMFDADGDGDLDIYVASGGAEFADGSDQYQDRLYLNDGKGNFTTGKLPVTRSSGSCVLAFDADGDGDKDIFRGGQVIAGVYPKAPRSYLLINEGGTFKDKTRDVAPQLNEPGLVKTAAVADLNNDKQPELIVSGEWMPVRIFSMSKGIYADVSREYLPEKTEGWWSRIVVADLDSDGDQDLLLGNTGENYKFRASENKPFQVYARDFDGNGTNDIFLARYLSDSTLVPIRGRECTSQQMPVIAKKFPTFVSFADSDLAGILGSDIESAMHQKAYTFSSFAAINDNGKLSLQKLPVDAQLSVINDFIVHDFDQDGKQDILIAGNKFDTEVETTPADASPGLLLKNLGGNKYQSLKSFETGFFVPYNVKDLQLMNVGNTPVIFVSSNNDKLRIFRVKPPQPEAIALEK